MTMKQDCIINHHRSGMTDLNPIDRASARRIVSQSAYNVRRSDTYGDRHFELEHANHLIGRQLRIRDTELAGKPNE